MKKTRQWEVVLDVCLKNDKHYNNKVDEIRADSDDAAVVALTKIVEDKLCHTLDARRVVGSAAEIAYYENGVPVYAYMADVLMVQRGRDA